MKRVKIDQLNVRLIGFTKQHAKTLPVILIESLKNEIRRFSFDILSHSIRIDTLNYEKMDSRNLIYFSNLSEKFTITKNLSLGKR